MAQLKDSSNEPWDGHAVGHVCFIAEFDLTAARRGRHATQTRLHDCCVTVLDRLTKKGIVQASP